MVSSQCVTSTGEKKSEKTTRKGGYRKKVKSIEKDIVAKKYTIADFYLAIQVHDTVQQDVVYHYLKKRCRWGELRFCGELLEYREKYEWWMIFHLFCTHARYLPLATSLKRNLQRVYTLSDIEFYECYHGWLWWEQQRKMKG